MWDWSVSMAEGGPLPGHRLLTVTPGRAGELSGVSSIRALISFMGAPPSRSDHLPKTPPSNPITFGNYDFNMYILEGHKHWDCSKVT